MILKCPSCENNLTVNRLVCAGCGITVEGDFAMPALLKLTAAQLDFIEVFVKNRGVIRELERELGVSYPTVRARLDEVIHALGFQILNDSPDGPGAERIPVTPADEPHNPADPAADRRTVLADLRAGRITPEQALATLGELQK